MRRTPAFSLLVIVAAISIGCSKSDQGSAPNANAPGTTTYSNSSAPSSTVGGATSATPRSSPSSTNAAGERIKPPTDK